MHLPTLRLLSLIALGALGAPTASVAQEYVLPTPEEYEARQQAAEQAPLFQTSAPLRMTLRTDIKWLRDERNDSIEVEGTLTFIDLDGSEVTKPVDTRARGNFRRNKANCNFPPLRLDFPTGQMKGTVFEGQDKLKLVTPCNQSRDDNQNYVFDEYLAYRILNILTPHSFRVRLVEVTYEDVNGDQETRTKFGFFIEEDEAMAERNRATLEEVNQFHPLRANGAYSTLVAMYNYMIANTDWSPVFFHNVKLIRTESADFLTVPYDFDFSGLVNARYATIDPSLQNRIRRVTSRLFRGFCRDELVYPQATGVFVEKRGEIEALIRDFAQAGHAQFGDEDAKKMIEFLDDFYEVSENPKEFENEITKACRDIDGGRRP